MNQSELPVSDGFKICDLGALAVAWPAAEVPEVIVKYITDLQMLGLL